jgi:antigen flippase
MSSAASSVPLQQPRTLVQSSPPQPKAAAGRNTYGQILKSSAWIGGSAVINVGVSIVRTKAMAMLLGPAGIGLFGLFGSISDLTRSVAGMGITGSGVRQIAEAVGSGDEERIARTVTVLRRISLVLGILGGAVLVLLSRQVSVITFGTDRYANAVALLSLAVLFGLVSGGQGALIQGMRRISDLARMTVWGALAGSAVSILIVYFLGENGIVPSLIGGSGISVLISWWFSRKVKIRRPRLNAAQTAHEAAGLLKLGVAFMASGMLVMGVAYFVRITVLRRIGYEASGYYQSAWALGGLYVAFILQAMGTDFYPRLTGIAGDDTACNRMVNEQAHVSMLLAGPGILATLTFAPTVVTVFYSPEFVAAAGVLKWICLGMAMRVVIWPIGFVVLAKGASKTFFWTEFAWAVVHAGLAWAFVPIYGLNGAGIAFCLSYVFHGCVIYPVVRRLSGFRWSAANRRTGLLFVLSIGVVFGGAYVLPPLVATSVGLASCILGTIYSVRTLVDLVSTDQLPAPVRRILGWLRFLPAGEVASGGR